MRVTLPNSRRSTLIRFPSDWKLRPVPKITPYDGCLARDSELWDMLIARGGLVKRCCPQGRPKYLHKPWIAMPKEGRRFKPINYVTIASAIPFTGLDIPVLDVYVPNSYDGVITDVVCGITAPGATGFLEGSGDITWRLSANGRFLRDMGNIQSSLGSLVTPSPVPRGGLRVFSRNRIIFSVALAVGAEAVINPAGRIVCSITGWWYPR